MVTQNFQTLAELIISKPGVKDSTQQIEAFIDKQIETRMQKLRKVMELRQLSRSDIRQEFLLAIIEAMPGFDTTQSTWRTYISKVCNNRYLNFRREYRLACKCMGNVISLDEIGNDESGLIPTYEVDFETQHDVNIVLEKLPKHLREIAELLKTNSLTKTASLLGVSRCTISRGVKQIRGYFQTRGFEKFSRKCNKLATRVNK